MYLAARWLVKSQHKTARMPAYDSCLEDVKAQVQVCLNARGTHYTRAVLSLVSADSLSDSCTEGSSNSCNLQYSNSGAVVDTSTNRSASANSTDVAIDGADASTNGISPVMT